MDSCSLLSGTSGRRAGDEGLRVLETRLFLGFLAHVTPPDLLSPNRGDGEKGFPFQRYLFFDEMTVGC